jgi:hypothetical protein
LAGSEPQDGGRKRQLKTTTFNSQGNLMRSVVRQLEILAHLTESDAHHAGPQEQ